MINIFLLQRVLAFIKVTWFQVPNFHQALFSRWIDLQLVRLLLKMYRIFRKTHLKYDELKSSLSKEKFTQQPRTKDCTQVLIPLSFSLRKNCHLQQEQFCICPSNASLGKQWVTSMVANSEMRQNFVIQYCRNCCMEIRNCPRILFYGLSRWIGRIWISGGLPNVKVTTATNSNSENSYANPMKSLTSPEWCRIRMLHEHNSDHV